MKIKTNSKNNSSYTDPNPQVIANISGISANIYEDLTPYLNKKETFRIYSNNHYIKITLEDSTIVVINRGTYTQPTIAIYGNRIDINQGYANGYNMYNYNYNWVKIEICRSSGTMWYEVLKY